MNTAYYSGQVLTVSDKFSRWACLSSSRALTSSISLLSSVRLGTGVLWSEIREGGNRKGEGGGNGGRERGRRKGEKEGGRKEDGRERERERKKKFKSIKGESHSHSGC